MDYMYTSVLFRADTVGANLLDLAAIPRRTEILPAGKESPAEKVFHSPMAPPVKGGKARRP
eukprot:SAG31_NODE_36257_length_315_cov_0.712963_1_plen_60_part_01